MERKQNPLYNPRDAQVMLGQEKEVATQVKGPLLSIPLRGNLQSKKFRPKCNMNVRGW